MLLFFLNIKQSAKYKVSEVSAITGVVPGSAPWGRRVEPWEQAAPSEDSLGCTGRRGSLAWSAFGRGDIVSLQVKDIAGNIELSHSPA